MEFYDLNERNDSVKKEIICYNCGTEIIDKNQKRCPNCDTIFNPNDYIEWKMSCLIFISFLCGIPAFIALIQIIMNNS